MEHGSLGKEGDNPARTQRTGRPREREKGGIRYLGSDLTAIRVGWKQ